jgi:hypothetical protein
MPHFAKASLLFLALAPLAQAQEAVPVAVTRPQHRMGAYQVAAKESPFVLEAIACVQRHMPLLRLDKILEAYTQVVAGINIKLLCNVTTDGELSQWEFVVFRNLDGQYHLSLAKRL